MILIAQRRQNSQYRILNAAAARACNVIDIINIFIIFIILISSSAEISIDAVTLFGCGKGNARACKSAKRYMVAEAGSGSLKCRVSCGGPSPASNNLMLEIILLLRHLRNH